MNCNTFVMGLPYLYWSKCKSTIHKDNGIMSHEEQCNQIVNNQTCLFSCWDYPRDLGQINLVFHTYPRLDPRSLFPRDPPPRLWPAITFYPESSYRSRARPARSRAVWFAHTRGCGGSAHGAGSALALTWGRGRRLWQWMCWGHMFTMMGERGKWSRSGSLNTVSFENELAKYKRYFRRFSRVHVGGLCIVVIWMDLLVWCVCDVVAFKDSCLIFLI